METATDVKAKVLEFAEQHPYMLLAAVAILVIIIVVLLLNSGGYLEKMGGTKKKKTVEDDAEIDSLIESIHNKQQKRKGTK